MSCMGCNQPPDLVVVRRPAPDRLAEVFPAVEAVFLAGASFIDVMISFNASRASVSFALWSICACVSFATPSFVAIAVFLAKEKKCNSAALVIVGLSLLFFNVLIYFLFD